MFKKFHKNKYNSGVTLVELLVVMAILAIMSATTLVSYSKFRSSMSIQNLADDIALSVRKAQGYAIGVRGVNSIFSGYGVHFTKLITVPPSNIGSNKSFILFANVDGDTMYDRASNGSCGIPTTNDECLEILNITSTDKISNISYGTPKVESNITNQGTMDIFFSRPNPEPTFCYKASAATSGCTQGENITYVKIQVVSEKDSTVYKTITIWKNGQISIS